MGSSPVTATTSPDSRLQTTSVDLLDAALAAFFRDAAPLAAGDGVVVAFSGGADSTALLLGMSRLAVRRGLRLAAAHFDHALDPGSRQRAEGAARLAGELGVMLVTERAAGRPAADGAGGGGESPEAAARRARYHFLERTRAALGARFVATAHHRDDQAETVLLRLLFGSGLSGLAGIRPLHGAVVRPLLALPRRRLLDAVAAAGLAALDDPTNRDLEVPRNRVRHRLLPALAATDPEFAAELPGRLAGLAAKARGAGLAIDRCLAGRLPLLPAAGGIAVPRDAFAVLPADLHPFALAWLHRQAGAPYPASEAARRELGRQLAASPRAACACDAGGGWRWEATRERLILRRDEGARERVADFTYTLKVPGELAIPEIAVRLAIRRRAVEPWMLTGATDRAALALPLTEGDLVTVRNRRPGDRIHPLGACGSRRLKEVLIDRRVPRHLRDRLPLLVVGGRIAWVAGVTIDERFRLAGDATAWVAEVTTT